MSVEVTRNQSRADRVIGFMNLLPLVDGPAVGQRFKVDPWVEAWIREIYEPETPDGNRLVRRAILSVARKNAKSYAVAGLLLCHLIGPEAIINGQVFSCAVDREQAAVIFHMCRKMIAMTPALQKWLTVIPSTKTIIVKRTDTKARGSVYRALSAESSTKHGLGPSFFVYDEFGEARNDELWNTMFDGQQAVASPLAVVISTQNHDPQHPLSLMIDDGLKGEDPTTVCHVHAADPDCALDDREQWFKANPAILTWKSIGPIEVAAAEAMRMPSKEQNFRRRYLNQRVSAHSSLIAAPDWRACEDKALTFREMGSDPETNAIIYGEPVYLALDMSMRVDLTALVMVSVEDGSRVKSWFWKPADYLEEHTRRDRVSYDVFAREGSLNTTPGRTITPITIVEKIAELCGKYDVRALVYDRWHMDELLRLFGQIGLHTQEGDGDGLRVEKWGQGYKDMSPAVTAFEEAILTGDLKHDGHPLLTFCVMNAQVTQDGAGGRKLDKEKSRFRIDGAVALAMALGYKSRDREIEIAPSPYEDPDFKHNWAV